MQNLRKNKNKVVTTQMMGLSNEEALDRDMNEDMGRASIIVSFCSAGLLDAYVGGKKIIAIRIPKIPDADYAIFENAIQLNKLKDLSLQSYSTEINSYYFNVDNNQLEICRNILKLK